MFTLSRNLKTINHYKVDERGSRFVTLAKSEQMCYYPEIAQQVLSQIEAADGTTRNAENVQLPCSGGFDFDCSVSEMESNG